jgi:hypothetical protein
MKKDQSKQFCRRTRREFLWDTGAGFTGLAMASMLDRDGFLGNQAMGADGSTPYKNPLAPKNGHFPGKAKAVIFLYMYGGPSQVDTFEMKPKLGPLDGKTIDIKTFGRGGHRKKGRVVGPQWKFKQYGQCGKWVSDLFPHLGGCVDDMTFIHSMYADSPIHGSAMLMMNSGRVLSGSPAMGSWVNYGLGSPNENLPGFVVMLDKKGGPISGAKNWSSGYMPASYQGVVMRSGGTPILDLKPPAGLSPKAQRAMLDQLKAYNEAHEASRTHNSNLAARIASYELAYKMQTHAPEAVDMSKESNETKEMYGIEGPNKDRTADFGNKCLLARRLVERGVRFVQIYSGGAHNDDNWDAHSDMKRNHNKHSGNTDKPIAGLIQDLKRRGMLEDTLIVWGGEFGRQPTAEYGKGTGRDHNSYGFTVWMAGGGIKAGYSYGKTDELGNNAVEGRAHVKNMHATILTQMGLSPEKLSYFYGGLDQRLVGVEGAEPIHDIIA